MVLLFFYKSLKKSADGLLPSFLFLGDICESVLGRTNPSPKEMEMEGDSLLSDRPPPFFLGIFMKKKERKANLFPFFILFFPK